MYKQVHHKLDRAGVFTLSLNGDGIVTAEEECGNIRRVFGVTFQRLARVAGTKGA